MRPLCIFLALNFAFAIADASAGALDQVLAAELLHSLRPAPESERQKNAGSAIRDFKRHGFVPSVPQRIDYTDYYPVQKSLSVLGHDVVLLEEEYMRKNQYVGCCVSGGGGLVLKLNGSTAGLEEFATSNKCKLREYESSEKFKRDSHVAFPIPSGRYAELSCRARDADE